MNPKAIKELRSLDSNEFNKDPVDETSDFEFQDVEPNDSLRHEVKGLIHRIYEVTPDGSVIRGTLRRVKDGYKGVFKIFHSGGQMIAETIQRSADETVRLLEKQIWGKIKNWRKTRFSDSAPEHFELS